MDQMRTVVICLVQFFLFAAIVSGDTQSLSWLSVPSSMTMKADCAVPLQLSDIPQLAAAVLGTTPNKQIQWDCMKQKSFVFDTTNALVHITIDGINKDDIASLSEFSTAVQSDSSASLDWNGVCSTIEHLFYDSIVLEEDKIQPLKVAGLPSTLPAAFLDELYHIYGLYPYLKEKHLSASPDLVTFHITSLPEVFSKNNPNVAKEAVQLLSQAIKEMVSGLNIIYGDRLMVQVLTVPTGLATVSRVRRQTGGVNEDPHPTKPNVTAMNLADEFSDDYSAMFNIIMWTSFALALTVLAISCGMWNMDPGRDSIIYRMTSQRMKKDQ